MAGYDLRLTDPVYLENIIALVTRYGRLLHAVVLLREIFTYM
uniref:Gamma-tubulin complex component n=1 Tax=Steinernema glaseri TaxID=37863 RepID=A0A1I8A8T0_9BILA